MKWEEFCTKCGVSSKEQQLNLMLEMIKKYRTFGTELEKYYEVELNSRASEKRLLTPPGWNTELYGDYAGEFELVGSFEQGGYKCPKCGCVNNAYVDEKTCPACGYGKPIKKVDLDSFNYDAVATCTSIVINVLFRRDGVVEKEVACNCDEIGYGYKPIVICTQIGGKENRCFEVYVSNNREGSQLRQAYLYFTVYPDLTVHWFGDTQALQEYTDPIRYSYSDKLDMPDFHNGYISK